MTYRRARERGMSLIAMLLIVVLVGGVASAFMVVSTNQSRATTVLRDKMRATYLAEATVEEVINMLRTAYANGVFRVPDTQTSATFTINGRQVTYRQLPTPPDPSGAPARPRFQIRPARPQDRVIIGGIPGDYVATKYNELRPQRGATAESEVYFEIEAEVRLGNSLGYVIRNVELEAISLFNFLVFYGSSSMDLEFLPGPAWTGTGKIHTNADLYIAAGTSIDLYTTSVQAAGEIYRHRKDNGSYTQNGGPVRIRSMDGSQTVTWGANLESAIDNGAAPPTDNPNWPTDSAALQALGVKSRTTGATRLEIPNPGSILPPTPWEPQGGHFYKEAANPSAGSNGLVIVTDTAGNTRALFNDGRGQRDVTSDLVRQGVLSTSSISDCRESKTQKVPVTVVDMQKLVQSRYYPSNGVLYAYRQRNPLPPGPDQPPTPPAVPEGILIKNGKELGNGGVTIASNGPVYVQGDFNAPTNPARKQPAAVIADAVNLLSNAWDNSKPVDGSRVPAASDTTYNMAIITGQVPTPDGGGPYSGGWENLPRFHENWSGKRCTIRGSFINLWRSYIADGLWGQSGVYSPPIRDWNFDTDFADPEKPKPPAFLNVISTGRTVYEEMYRFVRTSGGSR
jgi:type II secretory pathway pseudopilin PulG